MKAGDLVIITGVRCATLEFVGLPCRVEDSTEDRGYQRLTPLRDRPDGYGRDWFYWQRDQLAPARKVVRLRKTCQAAGVDICDRWAYLLEQFSTIDELVQYARKNHRERGDSSNPAWQYRYILWELEGSPEKFTSVWLPRLHEDLPISDEEVTEAKAFLEALSDKLGTTEYVRCDT